MSITIIDKTKPYSPILEYKPPPVFKTDIEKVKYYEKMRKQEIEGIGEIPGTLVHKTFHQVIKNRNSGIAERPICRDVDLMIHQSIRDCIKKQQAELIIKGRGIGLSTDMGCLGNYYMRLHPGSTTLMTSSNQTKLSSLFRDKFKFTYDNYIRELIPRQINLNQTKNNVYIRAEIKYKRPDGDNGFAESEIYCLETSDTDASASAFSGKGCIFGCFDEIFLHKRRSLLMRSSSSCFIEQATGNVVAFLLAGGTCEDTLSNEEISLLQTTITDVQENGVLGTIPANLLFISSLWGKFMTNGHTDFKKAQEWHDKELERLSKLEDKSNLRAFRMNNPVSLDDIFNLNSGGLFSETVSDKIKVRLRQVITEKIPQPKYNIVDMKGTLEAYPEGNGRITIHEMPKKGIEYYLCIDGVATGIESAGEGGSFVAGIINKTFDPDPEAKVGMFGICAKYYERPKTVEQSYIYLVDLAKYYNKFDGFKGFAAEGNVANADHFSTYLKKVGMGKYIMFRKDLSGKGNSNTKRFFQYIDSNALDYQIRQANPFFEKYTSSINDKETLQDLLKPKNVNADLRSAELMFMIALPPDFDKPIVKIQPRTRLRRVIEIMSDGTSIERWINIDKGEDNDRGVYNF